MIHNITDWHPHAKPWASIQQYPAKRWVNWRFLAAVIINNALWIGSVLIMQRACSGGL